MIGSTTTIAINISKKALRSSRATPSMVGLALSRSSLPNHFVQLISANDPELQGYLAAREHMMNEGLVKATSPQMGWALSL